MKLSMCFVLAMAVAWTGSARAVTLSLSSDPAAVGDQINLNVGDTATIYVNLGNLGGTELSSLDATVEVSSATVFDAPSSAQFGAIVPVSGILIGPGEPTLPGYSPPPVEVSGSFFAGLDNITQEGVFFSFQLEALNAGTGTISINPLVSATDSNLGFVPVDVPSTPLQFVVTGEQSGSPVPEPTTALLGLVGMGMLAARRRWQGPRSHR